MDELASCQTISAFLARAVAARADEPALGFICNGELHWRTWREIADDAANLAAAIQAAGIEPGDRVAHVSENRVEWIITDLAIHLAGAVHVPIHVTLSGEQIAAQIADCDARLAFASTNELVAKFAGRLEEHVEVWIHDDDPIAGELRLAGKTTKPQAYSDANWIEPSPHELATILYTSGTTGRPRGVMLSHANLAANAAATADAFGAGPDVTRLCILPLSHIYARTCDLYTWVYRGSRLVLAESRDTLSRDCQLARPTALSAVPYVYQRIAGTVHGSPTPDELAALRDFFGGRVQWLSCGGAPLAPDVETWFAEQGLPILPGYGLTESAPVISLSTPARYRIGAVGPPLSNVEVRIAADGEILARGPNIMLGYWRDETATADVLRNGWLHTGDLGEVDADGFLFIRGRKKELIVLSTGKNVSPARVENLLTASPLIDQAAVFGDGQCALVALIVPAACHVPSLSRGGLARDTCAHEIAHCLAAAAHEEQIRDFAILDRPFSIDRGELTPKLSLCREVIARNFATELKQLGPQRSQSSQREKENAMDSSSSPCQMNTRADT